MSLENKKILLVEDDEQINRVFRDRLAQAGADVISVFDGHQALQTLKAGESIDLILTDLSMPQLSGYDMLHLLRSDTQTTNIPVLVLTNTSNHTSFNSQFGQQVDIAIALKSDIRPAQIVEKAETLIANNAKHHGQ